jgi:hypothetical protein
VKDAIVEQRKIDVSNSALVVYGFPEDGYDGSDLADMFDYLRVRCDVIHCERMGRPPTTPSEVSPYQSTIEVAR